MDPITGLGGIGSSTATSATAGQSLGTLGPDAFLNLMVAQMRYQDPLAPSDANAMMQQTSMLAQTELMTKLADAQQALLGMQRATMATDLVGSHVQGVDAAGATVQGTVDAVRFSRSGPLLVVGGVELALEDTYQLGGTAPVAPPAADGTTDPVDQPVTTPTDPVIAPVTDGGTA
jgi:flagellar basal-body rod modification protein FlgD